MTKVSISCFSPFWMRSCFSSRSSVVIDFARQLEKSKPVAQAYLDLSVSGDAEEAAASLFAALRWAEAWPSAQRLLICGVYCRASCASYTPGVGLRNPMISPCDRVSVHINSISVVPALIGLWIVSMISAPVEATSALQRTSVSPGKMGFSVNRVYAVR